MKTEVAAMMRSLLKPKLIFERCLDLLTQNRMTLPKSYFLTDLIRAGLKQRRQELSALVDEHLLPDTRQLLDDLFEMGHGENRYRLTLLKKLSQSTRPTKIKESAADFQTLSQLYRQFADILPLLELGTEGIRYYAGSVLKSRMFQLNRRTDFDRYVHAIAFITHQLYRLQDNLVDVWLSVVRSFQNTVSREHKEQIFTQRKEANEKTLSLLDRLDADVLGLIRQVRHLTDDEGLSDRKKVEQIRSLVSVSPEETINDIRDDLTQSQSNSQYYDSLENRSLRLQNRLNPILKVVNFQACNDDYPLLAAIDHFKAVDGTVGHDAPLEFLEPDEHKAVFREDGRFRPSLYKVFLFLYIANAIKSGNLNLALSYKYRPLNDYLIDPSRWQREKPELMERAGLAEFADPSAILTALDTALYEQYRGTNANAASNPHLKILANGQFTIATPAKEESHDELFGTFYPEQHIVPLPEVLFTINRHCGFLESFQHWQQSHVPQLSSPSILFAAIMGLGCGIGVRKMAQISANITENELENTVNWRFSLENIQAANDQVLTAMEKMELPNLCRKSPETIHTASDGQKFEVRTESLNASRSFKYFGKEQGVSVYTFMDERNLLWHSLVFSASDRESAYVIDGLMRNDVVKSNIHSTDTHGYSEAIFGATYLHGFSYAPRIKNLKKQRLYLFRSRKKMDRSDWTIVPDKYINDPLILEYWDDLLRLIATIKLKKTTASDIFRRLNSYSRQHSLYQALKAFGQIIKSLFILRYIDDLELRQAIEKQLNKVELANKFTRAVAVGNPREFTQAEKEEQEIAEACNRLIKNCIICWNYLYLSHKLAGTADAQSRENLMRFIETHSPVAWAHINLLGEYDFSDEKLRDSIGILPLKS
ncbi:MAG: Tn3 family transposase, partial [Gammaproteobacteria bacterium]|nr:Tn3 family transposase [Gammaproteobacteria bacterium]